jgi:hypothetical protein
MPEPNGRRLLNRNFMADQPGGGRFVLAYQFGNRVEFYTGAGERYGQVSGPRETEPRFGLAKGRLRWEDGNEMAYSGAYATERYVYALFCGCRLGEDVPPSRVHVFRWNGDFVGEVTLDRPVLEIAVSPDDATLYAGIEEPYPGVGEWKLPEWPARAAVAVR